MRTIVTGGTGFIGRLLVAELGDPVVVSRRPTSARELGFPESTTILTWTEPTREPLQIPAEIRPQAVVHLMGESIAEERWSAEKRQRIRDSRVAATQQLVRALAGIDPRPQVLVSASAMGYYGSRDDQILDEAASSGTDFLAEVCRDWEAAAIAARELGIRVVLLRTGLVLGRGGFLERVVPIFRRGLGGPLGNGRHWTSWIHVADLIRLILACCHDERFSGPVNASTPFPLRNSEFTRALAHATGRPAIIPVPRLGLRLLYGDLADVMLASIRMNPAKALANGFEFQFPKIQEALADLIPAGTKSPPAKD